MRDERDGRPARVISVGRNAAWIAFEGEEDVRLAALPKNVERLALVPGDLVAARALDGGRVLVTRREPRSFALERTTGGGRHKTMAANIDGIAIVAAFARPALHVAMLDELLAFGELHEIGAQLVFTKADLVAPEDAEAVLTLYRSLGYAALCANPKTGHGVDAIEAALAGKRTLLIGQSGVGKSSLFRALGGSGDVGDVSKIGRGRQTTTTGRLHRTGEGFLIDSPGVGEFEVSGTPLGEIGAGFIEFVPWLGTCRFADCLHRGEPNCAIETRVRDGLIAASRYASYRAILEREAAARVKE